ncbi:MAG TPA: carbohydrate ABC transporter permease [Chloroflexota bacterium]|nr:carbohydrate ABC transporter permease [Chloroflexota bacterium]
MATALERSTTVTVTSGRPAWMEPPGPPEQVAKTLFLVAIAVVMLFPFVYVVAISFSSAKDVLAGGLILWPKNPSLDAYQAILRGGIVARALLVSTGLAVFGTAAKMVATVALAYGLSKRAVPGAKLVLFLVLGTLLFRPGLIPSYLLVKNLGLIDTYQSLILPGLISAFYLVILRNFFMNIPQELIEAARLDGGSDWQVLWHIVLPLSKAVLAVIALFYGVDIWNAFFNAVLYLNDASMWPVQLVLRQYVLQGSAMASAITLDPNQPPPPAQTLQMAIVVVATLPILVVYPFLQRYFTRGVLSGAIKA